MAPTARQLELCIDVRDPARVRPFWREALGYVERQADDGTIDLVHPDGVGPMVWFQTVPKDTTPVCWIHLDVRVPSQEERVALMHTLVGLGGVVLEECEGFVVMSDPEGHEVCLTD